MKALATVALVGLAYGSEDNELFRPLPRNATGLRPHLSIPHMPVVLPKPHLPINKNHTLIPSVKPHLPVHKNLTHVPHHKNASHVIHHPIHHKNMTHKPYHPIHKNVTAHLHNNHLRRRLAAEDDELYTPIYQDSFLDSTVYPNSKINPKIYPNWPWKQTVYADEDNELFVGRNRSVANPSHSTQPHNNRTRPFYKGLHFAQNRTHQIAAEDEKLYLWRRRNAGGAGYAADDDEFFFRKHNLTHKPTTKKIPQNHVPHKPNHKNSTLSGPEFLPIGHGSKNKTKPSMPNSQSHHNATQKFVAFEDEELFNLEKLLADASKTVGDVKQKEKNYGALLNDAINIVKDIKQKDDFEDSFLRVGQRVHVTP